MLVKEILFSFLSASLLIGILAESNDTSDYDHFINVSEVTHVRAKRATYETFLLAHTLDPGKKRY